MAKELIEVDETALSDLEEAILILKRIKGRKISFKPRLVSNLRPAPKLDPVAIYRGDVVEKTVGKGSKPLFVTDGFTDPNLAVEDAKRRVSKALAIARILSKD
jgi:hypothetical protein